MNGVQRQMTHKEYKCQIEQVEDKFINETEYS